jgi:hypothetical protein
MLFFIVGHAIMIGAFALFVPFIGSPIIRAFMLYVAFIGSAISAACLTCRQFLSGTCSGILLIKVSQVNPELIAPLMNLCGVMIYVGCERCEPTVGESACGTVRTDSPGQAVQLVPQDVE